MFCPPVAGGQLLSLGVGEKINQDDVVNNQQILQGVVLASPDHNPGARTFARAVQCLFPDRPEQWATGQGYYIKKLLGYARPV